MSSHLKTFRKSVGYSQRQLAALLDISKSTISMVENGRRELPVAATRKLETLKLENPGNINSPAPSSGNTFLNLKDHHLREAEEYLLSYKKDCEFALHKYEKQVREWTKRYEKAAAQFFATEQVILHLRTIIDGNEYLMLNYENQRQEATEALSAISQQQPEIVMVKIAGLKQELRSIKSMLGKQRRYLGMKEIPLSLPAQTPGIEDTVQQKELPKNE